MESRQGRTAGGPTSERDSRPAGPVVLRTLASWNGCLWRGRPGRIPARTRSKLPGRDLSEVPQGSAATRTGERLCGALLAAGFVRRAAAGRVVPFRSGRAKRRAGGVEGLPVEAVGQDTGHEPGDEHVGRDGLDAVPGLSLSGKLRPPAAEPLQRVSREAAFPTVPKWGRKQSPSGDRLQQCGVPRWRRQRRLVLRDVRGPERAIRGVRN